MSCWFASGVVQADPASISVFSTPQESFALSEQRQRALEAEHNALQSERQALVLRCLQLLLFSAPFDAIDAHATVHTPE
jgi:hypothetical protein